MRPNKVKVQCSQCGQFLYRIPAKIKRANHQFCSIICYNQWQRENPRTGSANPRWKGGRSKRANGYIDIRVYPSDFFGSMADHHGYITEHRLVMAKHLHRCLLPWEIVHHKNGIKDDNRLENLELLTSSSKHYAITSLTSQVKKLSIRVDKLEKENRLLRWQIKELNKREVPL